MGFDALSGVFRKARYTTPIEHAIGVMVFNRLCDAESKLKKLTQAKLIADTDTAVAAVAENPDAGERKTGDLSQLWVYKFRSQGQLYLLGYTREDAVRLIYLEVLGPHENFYRDLKH